MRRLILFLLSIFYADVVYARDISFDVVGTDEMFVENIFVKQDVLFLPSSVDIDVNYGDSIIIENYGVFHPGKLEVCSGCNVIFENYNLVDIETVVLNDDAHIFQIVSSTDNMVGLNMGAEYTTMVHGDAGLSLADVVDLSNDSNTIVLDNVILNINKLPLNKSKQVIIGDNVTFVISDHSYGYNTIVLDNVTNSSAVRFMSDNDDVMFRRSFHNCFFVRSNSGDFIQRLPLLLHCLQTVYVHPWRLLHQE